jgi:hypothetical protein
MQFTSLFLAVLITLAVIADGRAELSRGKHHHRHHHHHKKGKLERKCDELLFLEKLDNLVSNTTALAEKTLNNATKIADLQAKASKDASKFADLKSNHVECEILAAERNSNVTALGS